MNKFWNAFSNIPFSYIWVLQSFWMLAILAIVNFLLSTIRMAACCHPISFSMNWDEYTSTVFNKIGYFYYSLPWNINRNFGCFFKILFDHIVAESYFITDLTCLSFFIAICHSISFCIFGTFSIIRQKIEQNQNTRRKWNKFYWCDSSSSYSHKISMLRIIFQLKWIQFH